MTEGIIDIYYFILRISSMEAGSTEFQPYLDFQSHLAYTQTYTTHQHINACIFSEKSLWCLKGKSDATWYKGWTRSSEEEAGKEIRWLHQVYSAINTSKTIDGAN